MASKSTISALYGKNSGRTVNILMVLMFIIGAFRLVDNSFDDVQTIAAASSPLISAIILVVVIPAAAFLFTIASNVDRRCTEDYSFQLMANAALVAIMTLLAVDVILDLEVLRNAIGIRELRRDDMMGIAVMSWSSAYFIFRIRGLR